MSTVLSVRDLHVAFTGSGNDSAAVRGVSLDLKRGETLALVGESGSGKSVTALSTLGLLGAAAQVSGSVLHDGRELVGASAHELRRVRGNGISFIFQEPMTSLNPLHRIERQLGESLALHAGITGAAARRRIIELLDRTGIREPERRLNDFPHQLSGGERQRVMISMALANDPDVLIADEPTTALDVTIQAQILDLLGELQAAAGLAMLFITHDLGIVRRIADRVCVMHAGQIVETASCADIFARPQNSHTRRLLNARPSGKPAPPTDQGAQVLSARDVTVRFGIGSGLFRRSKHFVEAVHQARLAVHEGETLGIVGESGSGKTTLALALLRLLDSQGDIRFGGEDVRRWNVRHLRQRRRDMQIVFQDPFGSLSPRMTCHQIIAEGLAVHRLEGKLAERAHVAEVMIEVGLDPAWMDRYPHEFSGGQRQRIAIARAMILRPRLVVLDEPTSSLDMTVQVQIVDLLRELQRKYRLACLFISHDLNVVRAMSHRVLVMHRGNIVEAGDVEDIFTNPQQDYTRALLHAATLSTVGPST